MHPLFSNVGMSEIYHVKYLFEVVSLKEFFLKFITQQQTGIVTRLKYVQ